MVAAMRSRVSASAGMRVILRIAEHLQAVLDAAQEQIGGFELLRDPRRQQLPAGQLRQHGEQRLGLHAPVLPAAYQLEGLHDELDFADAARAELDVIGEIAARDFLFDERLHLAQTFEHAEVEVTPVDEGTHALGVDEFPGRRTGDGARLDPGVALPVAAVGLQVVVEECAADGERPAVAEGPQPHVHAMHDAFAGALAQDADHQAAEPGEEILVVDAARRRGSRPFRERRR